MRKAILVLELFHGAKLSRRRISQHLGISRSSVRRIFERVEQAKLSWPLPDGLTDTALKDRPYGTPASTTDKARTLPDRWQVHTALMYSFFGACKVHHVNPRTWLTDVFERLPTHDEEQLAELLPHWWKPLETYAQAQAA